MHERPLNSKLIGPFCVQQEDGLPSPLYGTLASFVTDAVAPEEHRALTDNLVSTAVTKTTQRHASNKEVSLS